MTIKHVDGDILTAPSGIICHQVNSYGVMGAGVAYQIAQKWPHVLNEYKAALGNMAADHLGAVSYTKVNDTLWVANLHTQRGVSWGRKTTEYEAYPAALRQLTGTGKPLHFPKFIGCGIAGGNWDVVYPMIAYHLKDEDVTIWNFTPPNT